MAITPDTKDWTWVLEHPCTDCGFDASALDATAVSRLIRENVVSWASALLRANATVRPDDSTWSTLEYAAHVRDVCRLFLVRLHLILSQDDPIYPNWDQDQAAIEGRYGEQAPKVVSDELVAAGLALADAFDAVSGEQWLRTGRRGDGATFTVQSFSKYLAHDPQHHLWDVRE